jgi:glutamyl-tRNA synthetase
LIQERIRTLDEAVTIAGFFFREEVDPQPQDLVGKKMDANQSAIAARRAAEVIADQPSMEPAGLEAALRALAEELEISAGQLFGILRLAVTGQKVSPPLIESMEVVGKDTVLVRIDRAIQLLESLR